MKIPAAFAPKSWEMPPGFRVLEESASVVTREFDGEKLDWLVALIQIPAYETGDPIYWTRPMSSKFDAGFVITGYNRQMRPLDAKTELYALRASLSTVWKDNRLARQFFLNENGELRIDGQEAHEAVLVPADGLAAWGLGPIDPEKYQTFEFRWSKPLANTEFLRLSACEVWKQVENLLVLPESEASFARRFVTMSEKERRSTIFNQLRGTDEEVEKLVRARVHMEGQTPHSTELLLSSSMSLQGHMSWECRSVNSQVASAEAIADIRQLIRWFRPINLNCLNSHCVSKWLRLNTHFSISVAAPTAHEQLEAHLLWREWLAAIDSEENQKL